MIYCRFRGYIVAGDWAVMERKESENGDEWRNNGDEEKGRVKRAKCRRPEGS